MCQSASLPHSGGRAWLQGVGTDSVPQKWTCGLALDPRSPACLLRGSGNTRGRCPPISSLKSAAVWDLGAAGISAGFPRWGDGQRERQAQPLHEVLTALRAPAGPLPIPAFPDGVPRIKAKRRQAPAGHLQSGLEKRKHKRPFAFSKSPSGDRDVQRTVLYSGACDSHAAPGGYGASYPADVEGQRGPATCAESHSLFLAPPQPRPHFLPSAAWDVASHRGKAAGSGWAGVRRRQQGQHGHLWPGLPGGGHVAVGQRMGRRVARALARGVPEGPGWASRPRQNPKAEKGAAAKHGFRGHWADSGRALSTVSPAGTALPGVSTATGEGGPRVV